VANAGPDRAAPVGGTVTLDGSGSFDVDGDTLAFVWSFTSGPPGSTVALSNPGAVMPSFTLDVAGNYTLNLTVSDGQVSSSDTVVVSTENSAPVADAGPDQSAPVRASVTLDGSGSSDADGDTLQYGWSFTTRPAGSTAVLTDPNTAMPSFTIDVAGNYVVQLVVSDGALNSAPDTVSISTINSAPVANAGPDQQARAGQTVTLDGSGSRDADGDALTYSWSLTTRPPGSVAALSSSTALRPTFIFDVAGQYVAQLIVNDGTTSSAPDTIVISPINTAPVANAGPDQSRPVGAMVALDGSGSTDAEGDPLRYSWSFVSRPAGSSAVLIGPNSERPSFTIDEPGDYVAQLIVNDGKADSAPDTVRISTSNSAPVAHAGADQSGVIAQRITLDGSRSSDIDGDPLTYAWTFVSRAPGSTATLEDASTVRPSFLIDAPGNFVIQLVVRDGQSASDPATVTVSTENSAPTANAGADQTRVVGDTVTLNGAGSTDPDGNALTYAWSLLSRPEGSTAMLLNANLVQATFVIDAPGDFVAQLVVSDGALESAPNTVVISTTNSRPVADAGVDLSVVAGETVQLDGRASFDVDGDPLTYQWSLSLRPPGSTAEISDPTAIQPSITTDLLGAYVAQLIVNDGTRESEPDTVSISASDLAGGCIDPPGAPEAAIASDGTFSDRVQVTWETVPRAFEYRVYRSLTDDPTTAAPVSEWVAATSFDDVGAAAPDAPICALFGDAEPGTAHVYWVRARIGENCASGLSASDTGFAGANSKAWFGEDAAASGCGMTPEGARNQQSAAMGGLPRHLGDLLTLLALTALLAGGTLWARRRGA
jgi:hypothetical protein